MVKAVSLVAVSLLVLGGASAMTAVYKPPYAPRRSDEWYRRNWWLGLCLMALSIVVFVVGHLIVS